MRCHTLVKQQRQPFNLQIKNHQYHFSLILAQTAEIPTNVSGYTVGTLSHSGHGEESLSITGSIPYL